MIGFNIDSVDKAVALARICEKYKDSFAVNVYCGSYMVDGASPLAIASLTGRIVGVEPVCETSNDALIDFIKEVTAISGC